MDLQEEAEDTYGAKYLPPLVRQPLPIGPSVTAIGVRTYRNMQGTYAYALPGDVVKYTSLLQQNY